MEKLATLFGQRRTPEKKRRTTERAELFDRLLQELNPSRERSGFKPLTHSRLGYLLTSVKTKDLYSLISKMADGERRGVPPSAIFWSEIRPQKTKRQ